MDTPFVGLIYRFHRKMYFSAILTIKLSIATFSIKGMTSGTAFMSEQAFSWEIIDFPIIDTNDNDYYITQDFLMGKFDYKAHNRFTKVPKEISSKEMYLQLETLNAFQKMRIAAKAEGISFIILSGTRNFNEQKKIWENKWQKYHPQYKDAQKTSKKILEYSSMPSTSRHHWGTDIDLNALNNEYFSTGKGKKEFEWLIKNAATFGFHQTYDSKVNGRTGYSEEKWHWSYLPLAEKYLTLYNTLIKNEDISGFSGCESAKQIDIIKNYVNGIAVR